MAQPIRDPPNPFPAWRLKNGATHATDSQLEAAATSCERWAWGCGGLVAFGLAAEVVLAIIHPPYESFWGVWGPVLADALVAIGVAGEVAFAKMGFNRQEEMRRRSDQKLAAAIDRASHTEAELTRLMTPRRKLLQGKEASMVERLRPFTGTFFDIGMSVDSGEQEKFAWALEDVLKDAGWRQIGWASPQMGPRLIWRRDLERKMDRPALGAVAAENVEIQVHPSAATVSGAPVCALISALTGIGIAVSETSLHVPNINEHAIHILLGSKT